MNVKLHYETNASKTNPALRYSILHKYNEHCAYCGSKITLKTLSIDHIVPQARNGSDYISNLNPSCIPCNYFKANNTMEYFRNALIYLRRSLQKGKDFNEFTPAEQEMIIRYKMQRDTTETNDFAFYFEMWDKFHMILSDVELIMNSNDIVRENILANKGEDLISYKKKTYQSLEARSKRLKLLIPKEIVDFLQSNDTEKKTVYIVNSKKLTTNEGRANKLSVISVNDSSTVNDFRERVKNGLKKKQSEKYPEDWLKDRCYYCGMPIGVRFATIIPEVLKDTNEEDGSEICACQSCMNIKKNVGVKDFKNILLNLNNKELLASFDIPVEAARNAHSHFFWRVSDTNSSNYNWRGYFYFERTPTAVAATQKAWGQRFVGIKDIPKLDELPIEDILIEENTMQAEMQEGYVPDPETTETLTTPVDDTDLAAKKILAEQNYEEKRKSIIEKEEQRRKEIAEQKAKILVDDEELTDEDEFAKRFERYEPSENQLLYANLIADTLHIPLPSEYTRQAFFTFIRDNKNKSYQKAQEDKRRKRNNNPEPEHNIVPELDDLEAYVTDEEIKQISDEEVSEWEERRRKRLQKRFEANTNNAEADNTADNTKEGEEMPLEKAKKTDEMDNKEALKVIIDMIFDCKDDRQRMALQIAANQLMATAGK